MPHTQHNLPLRNQKKLVCFNPETNTKYVGFHNIIIKCHFFIEKTHEGVIGYETSKTCAWDLCAERVCTMLQNYLCIMFLYVWVCVHCKKKKREKRKQKDTSLITFIPLCVNSHVGGRHSGLYPIHQPADTAWGWWALLPSLPAHFLLW